jgi:hypothetical protein
VASGGVIHTLGNHVIEAKWKVEENKLKDLRVTDRLDLAREKRIP